MFGIGMSELLVILAVALVVVGPGDLPKVARGLAKAIKLIRKTLKQFMDAINLEDELREVKEAGNMLRETVHDINPLAGVTDEIEAVKRETQGVFNSIKELPNMSLTDSKEDRKDQKAVETGAAQKEPVKEKAL
jgi:Tat protein translocase TatB subunit